MANKHTLFDKRKKDVDVVGVEGSSPVGYETFSPTQNNSENYIKIYNAYCKV